MDEGSGGLWGALEESDRACDLLFDFSAHQACILVLEGLSVDFGDLGGGAGWIATEDEIRLPLQEVAKVLVLSRSLLHVVSDWQQAYPVGHQVLGDLGISLDVGSLIFDDFAYAGDGVVAGVVIHRQLLLLVLNLGRDRKIDSTLERLQAELRA